MVFVVTSDVSGSDDIITSLILHVRRGAEVCQYVIHVTGKGRCRLAETDLSFPTLVDLITYYCQPNRRNNGLRLVLPEAIQDAQSKDELTAIARLSSGFWTSLPVPLSTSIPLTRVLERQTELQRCNHFEACSSASQGCKEVSSQSVWNDETTQRTVVVASPVYLSSTMPPSTRRSSGGFDPVKYQVTERWNGQTAQTVHPSVKDQAIGRRNFEAAQTGRSSPSVFRFDASRPPITPGRNPSYVEETGPSPIYVEPCDRLVDGLRHKVAVRRTGPASTVAVKTPPISATYKLPRDFLRSSTEHCDRASTSRSPQIVVSSASTLDVNHVTADQVTSCSREAQQLLSNDQLNVTVDFFLDQLASRSREGRGPQSRDKDRLSVSAAAADVVRRQRSSRYENMDGCDEGLASRRTTVSSARTEYSPPWDTDRWRFLIDPQFSHIQAIAALHQDDVDDGDDYFTYSELESASSTLDEADCIAMIPLIPRGDPPPPPPPRTRSLVRASTARTGCSMTVTHAHRQTSASSTNVVNNMSYRHRSPDVIPSLFRPRIFSLQNRGQHTPRAKISNFIVELAARKPEQTFGALVHNFVQCTLNGSEKNPNTVLSNIRQFMNGMKHYLGNGGEAELDQFIQSFQAKMLPSEFLNVDAVMETAMIKCIVKPLKNHIYQLFTYHLTRSGSLQMLCEGLTLIRAASPQDVGVQAEFLTSANEVSHFLSLMEKARSPYKKLEHLLVAMTTLSSSILTQYQETGSSVPLSGVNADDLLSTLLVILARGNLQSAEIEASYMWGLVDHSFLVGDSRYFLMTFSSAVDRLRTVRKSVENISLGHINMVNGTIKQADQEGYITVITPDESCDILVKHSLPVRQSVLVNDVCSMLAHRLSITNPQDYGLYSLKSTTRVATLLPANEMICPSKSSKDLSQVGFIYKRTNAYFVWSTSIGV